MARARTYEKRSKSRKTGTVVLICESDEGEIQEGIPWMTVCEDHGGSVCHSILRDARAWAPYPNEWCPTCQEIEQNADKNR